MTPATVRRQCPHCGKARPAEGGAFCGVWCERQHFGPDEIEVLRAKVALYERALDRIGELNPGLFAEAKAAVERR